MRLQHLALVLVVIVVWGFNFVVIKVGLQEIPPLLLCASRFILTSIPAVFFVKFPSTSFKMVALYGLIMFVLQFACLFVGMSLGVTPGLASLLVQTQAFFTTLLAIQFFEAKLHKWQVIGGIVAFSGIGLVGMNIGGSATLSGFILVVGSAALWSIGNVISKKIGKVNMFALVIWGSLVAWPPLLALSYFFEGPEKILYCLQHPSWLSVGSVLYITFLSTLFGYGTWSFLLHHYSLPIVAPFTLLVPIVAMASSVIVLGESLQSWKVFAGVLVIIGLCINVFGPRFFPKRG